jgi:hypothetical protein
MRKTRLTIALLMLPSLALGPIGCGEIAKKGVEIIVTTAVVAGIVAITVQEFQKVEAASLDNDMKRLRLQGMRDGMTTTVERTLTDDEAQRIKKYGEVKVNGKVLKVSFD